MNIDLRVKQHRTIRDPLYLVVSFVCKLLVYSMVKKEKSSDEFNRFISHVCISPGHAASFTGLDKLYRMIKNHFPAVTIKEIRKWAKSNLSYSLHKPSRRNFERNKVYGSEIYSLMVLIWLLYKM